MLPTFTNTCILAAALAASTQAAIVDNSYWADKHTFNETSGKNLTINAGIVSSANAATNQLISSGRTAVGHPDNYASAANATRVQRVFPEADFDSYFPDSVYSYSDFLRAVAKFPAFCNESNSPNGLDLDGTCKRELAAFFAHVDVQTQGLTVVEDPNCAGACWRGPLGINGAVDYGLFSSVFYEGYDRSAELVDNPARVSEDGYVAFASAMYLWMTAKLPATSPHNSMTGFF